MYMSSEMEVYDGSLSHFLNSARTKHTCIFINLFLILVLGNFLTGS